MLNFNILSGTLPGPDRRCRQRFQPGRDHGVRSDHLRFRLISFSMIREFGRKCSDTLALTSYHEYGSGFFRENRTTFILAIALFLAAFLCRSWQNVLHPGLYMEDAAHYFNIYYGTDNGLGFILQHPDGYYNILNNFIAWMVAKTDVRLQPMLYNSFALSLGMLTAICFMFSGLFRNRYILIATPMVLGLSGMNHVYYYCTLTYQLYNVVVLLLCLLYFPIPRSSFSLALFCVIAMLLIWSGPYSVVAFPTSLAFLILFKNRRKAIFFVTVLCTVLLYLLSVKEHTVRFLNILDKGLRDYAVKVLFEKIFFMDWLGKISFVKVGIFFLLLAFVFYLLRKDPFYIKISISFFIIILCALAPFFLSIKFLLYRKVLPCHIYISQFFWLGFILFTLDRLLSTFSPRRISGVLVVGLLFAFVTLDNIANPYKGREKILPNIPPFVRTIHAVEQLKLARKNEYVIVKTDNVMPGFLSPMVRVGSRNPTARRLGRKDVAVVSGKQFIVE